MKGYIVLLIVVVVILLLISRKTGMSYMYQEPSPYGIYSEEDCLVACSQPRNECEWCKTQTPLFGVSKENARNVFIQLPNSYFEKVGL